MRGERSQQQHASNATVSLGSSTASINGTHVTEKNPTTTRPTLITKENGDAQSHQKIIETITTMIENPKNAPKIERFDDTIPIDSNQCDINVNNTETRFKTTNGISDGADATTTVASSAIASTSTTTNNGSHNNNNYNDSDQHLSLKIRERIDSETRLIEDKLLSGFDKTVTGIVELKDDLMRVNDDEMYTVAGMKMVNDDDGNGGLRKRNLADVSNGKEIETFLRKEMNNVANVKVVLGNSQAD